MDAANFVSTVPDSAGEGQKVSWIAKNYIRKRGAVLVCYADGHREAIQLKTTLSM